MFSKALIVCSCLLVLSGCIYNDEPMPKIVQGSDSTTKVIQPKIPTPARTQGDINENIPKNWLLLPQVGRKWTAIVIHHSATKNGNVAIFDKWHREGKHWEGVGYHFVIGNGTDSGDGEVEVTFRWRNQMTGAHCGGTAGNWANKEAVGICLVGNFDYTVPTARQMLSLVKLIRFLHRHYGISKSRIYGHRDTPGAWATDCPGKKFPMGRLKWMLGF